jgi:hypothetical protein
VADVYVRADGTRLAALMAALADGLLSLHVGATLPLAEAATALEGAVVAVGRTQSLVGCAEKRLSLSTFRCVAHPPGGGSALCPQTRPLDTRGRASPHLPIRRRQHEIRE